MKEEIKHIPAPWHRNVSAKYPIYAGTNQHNWKHICSLIDNGSVSDDEMEANLNLITSAPELLHELEQLAKACEDNIDVPQSVFDVINKARGK